MEVIDEPKLDGEGAVYFSNDGRYAVKVYHRPRPDKEQLLQYVMTLFQSLPSDKEQFISPYLT